MYVLELVSEHARWSPQRVAVTDTTKSLTYRDLVDQAAVVASSLTARGVEGRAVPVCGFSVDMVAAMIGVWRAGAAFMPVEPGPRFDIVAEDTDSPILLCSTD